MMRRLKKLENQGYTLVELIIVIAIIAVLTGLATLTVGTINSARAQEAAITFESEIATVHGKAKGKAIDADCDGNISEAEQKNYNYGLRIYESGDRLYVQQVVIKDGVYLSVDVFEEANNAHDGKGTRLPANVYCVFKSEADGNTYNIGDGNGTVASVIIFSRNGKCEKGYGTYEFYKNNGNLISKVTINKNGSYDSK